MSGKRSETLDRLVRELEAIIDRAHAFERRYAGQLALLHPRQARSGRNLLHYLALRQSDLRALQNDLASLGLSSLGRSEAHVMASVFAVLSALRHLQKIGAKTRRAPVTIRQGRERIRAHTNELLGRKLRGSSVRIMVTFPDEAADDYGLVLDFVKAGMNCARINCAHGGPEQWERMVAHMPDVVVAEAEDGESALRRLH